MTAPPRRSALRRWLGRGVALGLGLLVALGVLEVAARVLSLVPRWDPVSETAILLHYDDPNGAVRLTPGWSGLVSGEPTTISAQGWRDAPYGEPGEVPRVAFVGDSYTLGDGVALADTFAKRVGRALAASGSPVETLNAGISATNTLQQVHTLKRVLERFRPEAVVVAFNLNDLEIYEATRFQRAEAAGERLSVDAGGKVTRLPSAGEGTLYHAVYTRSYLLRFIEYLRYRSGPPPDPVEQVEGWLAGVERQRALAAFDEMKALCDAANVKLSVVILPALLNAPRAREMTEYPFTEAQRALCAELASRGISCADVGDAFAGRDLYTLVLHPKWDRHYTAEGHGLIAERLTPIVRGMLQ